MNPITFIEIITSVILVAVLFVMVFVIPKNFRKIGGGVAVVLTVCLLLFFYIRPFWIEYNVTQKSELLSDYLMEKYPGQEWEIRQKEGRQYNPYHLEVEFGNEKDWVYTYTVIDAQTICQISFGTPDDARLDEGKHFEGSGCAELLDNRR